MAIKATDLLVPNGPVELELFPGEKEEMLSKRLNSFIAQAEGQSALFTWPTVGANDEATKSYALYLAFRQAYTLAIARPAEVDTQAEMLGRTLHEQDQRKGLKDLSDWYWGEWIRFSEDTLTDPESAVSTGIPSHQSSNRYDW